MIKYATGSMFEREHDAYVNTINCVGAMGAGIAKDFKERYPHMYDHYVDCCKNYLIAPGDCWLFEEDKNEILIGLAVKYHFRNKIRLAWAKCAIRNFTNFLKSGFISAENIALPRIGATIFNKRTGKISRKDVHGL